MRTVDGAERIVDVGVGQIREPARECRIVRLLAGVEPQVLQQDHGVVGKFGGRRLRQRGHRSLEELGQPRGGRRQPELVPDLSLRPAQMRREHQRRAAIEELVQRRERGADAHIVGDRPVLHGDVEVHPDEDAKARDVAQSVERSKRHSLDATSCTRSTSRLEYPHSLSYQPMTFTTLPMAIVDSASNVHEAGEPTMSLETIGSSV